MRAVFVGGSGRALAKKAGRPDPETWIDQTPTNIHHGRLLAAAYPGSAFVHVVQDGRAVAASVLGLDWGSNDVQAAARTWTTDVAAGLALQAAFPDRLARVAYEDLVADPEAALKAVCERIGLAYDPRMAEGGAFDRPACVRGTPERRLRAGPLPDQPVAGGPLRREVEAFEWVAQGVLANLGYPLVHAGFARRPPVAWDLATRLKGRAKKLVVDPIVRRRRKKRGLEGAGDSPRLSRPRSGSGSERVRAEASTPPREIRSAPGPRVCPARRGGAILTRNRPNRPTTTGRKSSRRPRHPATRGSTSSWSGLPPVSAARSPGRSRGSRTSVPDSSGSSTRSTAGWAAPIGWGSPARRARERAR